MNKSQVATQDRSITRFAFFDNVWVKAARPKTLWIGVSPVILGWALGLQIGEFKFLPALVCLLFALLIQIGCNFANDYYDFVKGADKKDRIGFPRAVASGWIQPHTMKRAMYITLATALVLGSILIAYGGWWLILIGVLCASLAILYTGGPFPLAYLGLGDLFVFIFFGILPVMFTFYVQTNYFSTDSLLAGIVSGLLAMNALILNNARDIYADKKVGKLTLAVRLGRKFSHNQYIFNLFAAYLIPAYLYLRKGHSLPVLLPVLTVPFAIHLIVKLKQIKTDSEYNPLFAQTCQFLLLYNLTLALGIAFF